MPVKEIIVLQKSGIPMFSFAPAAAPKVDALVAGFLSAQAGFAEEIGEGTVQVVSFAEHKFVYESRSELLFIVVIAQDDDEHVYRVILKEVAQAFIKKYEKELEKTVVSPALFKGFRDNLIEILQKYDRVPRMEARYPTAILPPELEQQMEELLQQVERSQGFLRAALITNDGYVVASKLQPHELEVTSTQLKQSAMLELPTFFAVSQTTLDEGTKLFVHLIDSQLVLVAIVRRELNVGKAAQAIAPIIRNLAALDTSSMVKVQPKTRITESFLDYEVLTSNPALESTLFAEDTPAAREFTRLFGAAGLDVLRAIDGVSTVEEIRTRTGVHARHLVEILNYLGQRAYIRKVQLYPKLNASDARFITFLEAVGLRRDEFRILEQARHFCDGHNSIQNIAVRVGVEPEKLVGVLRKLGSYVEWLT
jgi:predicted regulator of Ras-like GTPase activity (Roadblock/LC7/MglB family)